MPRPSSSHLIPLRNKENRIFGICLTSFQVTYVLCTCVSFLVSVPTSMQEVCLQSRPCLKGRGFVCLLLALLDLRTCRPFWGFFIDVNTFLIGKSSSCRFCKALFVLLPVVI